VIADLRAGDIILIRGPGWLGRIIRLGARIRYRHGDRRYAHWSHAALVLSSARASHGSACPWRRRVRIEKFRDEEFHYVRLDLSDEAGERRSAMPGRASVSAYGVLGFLLLGLSVALGDRFRVPDSGQQGCATLIVRAAAARRRSLRRAPSDMMPADLAKRLAFCPELYAEITTLMLRFVRRCWCGPMWLC